MTKQNLIPEELDAWRGERALDRMRAPARHAVAAWALTAALALAVVVGPPATRHVAAGLTELRHDFLMLDRELDRAPARIQSVSQVGLPIAHAVVAASAPDRTEIT